MTNFNSILLNSHSLLRYVVLILLFAVVAITLSGLLSKRPFLKKDRLVALFAMISVHIQLLIGLILYFTGPWFSQLINNTSMVMKNASLRFYALEHITLMLVAVVLVTLGYRAAKGGLTSMGKHRRVFILFALALIVIFIAIPWPFRGEGIGRPYFP